MTLPTHSPTCERTRTAFGGGFEAGYGFYFYYWWKTGAGGRT